MATSARRRRGRFRGGAREGLCRASPRRRNSGVGFLCPRLIIAACRLVAEARSIREIIQRWRLGRRRTFRREWRCRRILRGREWPELESQIGQGNRRHGQPGCSWCVRGCRGRELCNPLVSGIEAQLGP
jgi:hypothetical protein